jgi:hypothetical protein
MDHYLAGYYLVKQSLDEFSILDRPAARVWTPSECICNLFPPTSSLTWTQASAEEQESLKNSLGLSAKEYSSYQNEVDQLHDSQKIIWPNVFVSLEDAKVFFQNYLSHMSDVKLMEIAIPASYFENAKSSSAPRMVNEGESGLHFMLKKKLKFDGSKGTPMGYEVLGLEKGGHFHSLLCNHLQTEYSRDLGVQLNSLGLIDDLKDAQRAAEFTNRDGTGAEPVDWYPFLLTSHAMS